MFLLLPLLVACVAAPADSRAGGPWLEQLATYSNDEDYVYDVGWSPEGDLLATGSVSSLRLFSVDPDSGQPTLLDVASSDFRFNSITWSADGRFIIAPNGDRVRLYPVEGDALGTPVDGPSLGVELQRAALSPDQRMLLACDREGNVSLLRLSLDEPGLSDNPVKLLATLPVHERCTRVALSPGGHQGLSVGTDGLVALYRIDVNGDVLALAWTIGFGVETGEAIFAGSEERALIGLFGGDHALYTADVEPGIAFSLAEWYSGHDSGVGALEIDHAGDTLISGGHDHTTHLWRILPNDELERVYDHPDAGFGVHSARFSPDDHLVAVTASKLDQLDIFAFHDPD